MPNASHVFKLTNVFAKKYPDTRLTGGVRPAFITDIVSPPLDLDVTLGDVVRSNSISTAWWCLCVLPDACRLDALRVMVRICKRALVDEKVSNSLRLVSRYRSIIGAVERWSWDALLLIERYLGGDKSVTTDELFQHAMFVRTSHFKHKTIAKVIRLMLAAIETKSHADHHLTYAMRIIEELDFGRIGSNEYLLQIQDVWRFFPPQY